MEENTTNDAQSIGLNVGKSAWSFTLPGEMTPLQPTPDFSLQARRAFYAAKAIAQGQFKPIVKNREVEMRTDKGVIRFRYADWEEIKSKTIAALSTNGFSTSFIVEQADEKAPVWLHAVLTHQDGYEERAKVKLLGADNPKVFAAEISYFKRYLMSGLLDVAADDDLDENGQSGDDQPPAPPPPKQAPQRRSASAAAPHAPAPSAPPMDEPPPPEGFDTKPPAQQPAPPPPAAQPAQPPAQAPAAAAPAQQTRPPADPDPFEPGSAAPPPKEPESGELASAGEVIYIVKRATSRGAVLRPILDELGLKHLPDDVEGLKGKLLKSDWERIKAKV